MKLWTHSVLIDWYYTCCTSIDIYRLWILWTLFYRFARIRLWIGEVIFLDRIRLKGRHSNKCFHCSFPSSHVPNFADSITPLVARHSCFVGSTSIRGWSPLSLAKLPLVGSESWLNHVLFVREPLQGAFFAYFFASSFFLLFSRLPRLPRLPRPPVGLEGKGLNHPW